MALKIFNLLFLTTFFISNTATARVINSCYDEPDALSIVTCLSNKVDKAKDDYKAIRGKYVTNVSKMTTDYKIFQKKENRVTSEWKKLLEKDCEMRAMSAGDENGEAYNTAYLECVLDRYNERIASYENFFVKRD